MTAFDRTHVSNRAARLAAALAGALALAGCGAPSAPDAALADAAAEDASAAYAATRIAPEELDAPIAAYKAYVDEQVQALAASTGGFVEAIKAGDLEAAAALYPAARQPWERIEPIAELFPELDARLDARADDFKGGEADPEFTGWHRLEYAIFRLKDLDGTAEIADRLLADTLELQRGIEALELEPSSVLGGPAVLIEEVASTKISGEENRYSGTDLWDFKANVEGSQKIVTLFRPLIQRADPALLDRIDAQFAVVDEYLEKYRRGEGWASYGEVSEPDRNVLKGAVSALAEELALLRGTLGVD